MGFLYKFYKLHQARLSTIFSTIYIQATLKHNYITMTHTNTIGGYPIMKMYSLRGCNERYGITISMLKKLIVNKEITVVKIGTKNFIKEEDIEDYITKRTVKAKDV